LNDLEVMKGRSVVKRKLIRLYAITKKHSGLVMRLLIPEIVIAYVYFSKNIFQFITGKSCSCAEEGLVMNFLVSIMAAVFNTIFIGLGLLITAGIIMFLVNLIKWIKDGS
jgi:hypothetical protein